MLPSDPFVILASIRLIRSLSFTHLTFAHSAMPFRDKPDDLATAAEEYELGDNPQDHDPLLPRYEAEQRSVSPIKRRPSRRRRPFVWICLTLIILTIGAGAGVCFAAPSKVPSWDSLPQSLKDWINKALPNAEEALKDDANFPTK